MIRLARAGSTHDALRALMAPVELAELARVSGLRGTRVLVSEDFGTQYQQARPHLAEIQYGKCGYCEKRVGIPFNDVEHFRPKTTVARERGLGDPGYWWLAWHVPNLLFACAPCNRQHKGDWFPLVLGSAALPEGAHPPGLEQPALLDPIHEDPIDHIVFLPVAGERRWQAFAREGSERGAQTIQILQLNRASLVDDYEWHVREALRPRIDDLKRRSGSREFHDGWSTHLRALLRASSSFSALSHDVLDFYFPAGYRATIGVELPHPPI